ncbi:MAG: glycosyltransferase [Bacteroidota bacterium]
MTRKQVHIYLFAPIPFSFIHQRPQSLAQAFLAQGIPVTYIEPCGFTEYLAGRKKGLLRLMVSSAWYWVLGVAALLIPSLRTVPSRASGHPDRNNALSIVSMPLVVPQNRFNFPFLEKVNAAIFRQALRQRIFKHMPTTEESVAIVENPFFGNVLATDDFSQIYYDCLDEIALFSGHAEVERFRDYELMLVRKSRGIFVTAEKLEERMRTLRNDLPIVRVPNGVDFNWFQSRATETGTPDDIALLRKPIVGYVGVLRSWLDYDLVAGMARAMPDVSVVIVGPWDFEERIKHLRDIPNLYWFGRREYADVPRYINAFDVCIIPFLPGAISETTNPVKIFEYFALGKAVVSSPLHELQPYAKQGLLRIASHREEFVKALQESFVENDSVKTEERKEVARQNSWTAHVQTMLYTIRQS